MLDVLQCVGIVRLDRFAPVGLVFSVTEFHISKIGFDQRDQTGHMFNCYLKRFQKKIMRQESKLAKKGKVTASFMCSK